MAPLLFREIKRVSFSCASQASAATCSSIDRQSAVRPSMKDTQRTNLEPSSKSKSKPKSHIQKCSSRTSSEKSCSLISRTDSSRYLLSSSQYSSDDAAFFDIFPDSEPIPALVPFESSRFRFEKGDASAVLRPSSATRAQEQIVELRVSLHCKACEGKVRKHISKMAGVTSFSVDLPTKKVTVIGDVTPLGVLNSISKVKNAQFWPEPPRASASF